MIENYSRVSWTGVPCSSIVYILRTSLTMSECVEKSMCARRGLRVCVWLETFTVSVENRWSRRGDHCWRATHPAWSSPTIMGGRGTGEEEGRYVVMGRGMMKRRLVVALGGGRWGGEDVRVCTGLGVARDVCVSGDGLCL